VCHNVSQGPEGEQCSHFLVKPLHVRVGSYRVQVAAVREQFTEYTRTLIDLEHARPVFEKVLDPEESCRGSEVCSAEYEVEAICPIISISLSYHTPCFNRKWTPQELQNTFSLRLSLRGLSSPRRTLELPLPLLFLLKQYHCF
jgi:hypothetical protein